MFTLLVVHFVIISQLICCKTKLSGNIPPNYTQHILVGLFKTIRLIHQISDLLLVLIHMLLVINDTFNNITVLLWQLVLLVGKLEVFHLNKLYHIKLY